MRTPAVWSTKAIREHNVDICESPKGYWRAARPESNDLWGSSYRFRIAWLVLIGRYDALDWDFVPEPKPIAALAAATQQAGEDGR
jgi:hypothetical protein